MNAAHEAFFSTCFWDGALFAIERPVGDEMTSLLALFLASLFDLKDRTCSIFRLASGMLLSGSQHYFITWVTSAMRQMTAQLFGSKVQSWAVTT